MFYFLCFHDKMASKFEPSDESYVSPFALGRSRSIIGAHLQYRGSVGMDVGASSVLPARGRGLGLELDLVEMPMGQMSQDGLHHSTPSGESSTLHQLTDMITRLGSQPGESIAATLVSNGALSRVSHSDTPSHHVGDTQCSVHNPNTQPSSSENTPINVIVKADKEPVIFRGDNTDKYRVTEWVELIKSYIKKQKM